MDVIICDKCGRLIPHKRGRKLVLENVPVGNLVTDKEYDLCFHCSQRLMTVLGAGGDTYGEMVSRYAREEDIKATSVPIAREVK